MATLDPSIILGVKPVDVPDQSSLILKGLQAQGLMGQNQLQGLQIQQAQRAAEEQGRLTQVLSDPSFLTADTSTQRQKIMAAAPTTGIPLINKMLETQKTQGEIDTSTQSRAKSKYDLEHQQVVATGGELGAAADQGPDAVLNVIKTSRNIPDDQRAALLQMAQADPVGFAKRQAAGTLTAAQQLEFGRPGVIESPLGPVSYSKTNPNAGYTLLPNVQGGGAPTMGPPPDLPQAPAGPSRGAGAYGGGPSPMNAVYIDPSQVGQGPNAAPPRSAATQAAMDAINAQATGRPPMTAGATPLPAAQPQGQQPQGQPQAPVQRQSATNPFMKYDVKTDPATGRMVAVSTTPGPDGNFITKPVGTRWRRLQTEHGRSGAGRSDRAGEDSVSRRPTVACRIRRTSWRKSRDSIRRRQASDYPTRLAAEKSLRPAGKERYDRPLARRGV
jgi:hypothetical protein